MHSHIGLGMEGGSGGRRGLRAASLRFVAATPVPLAALGAGPDAAVRLLAVALLILAGSSAGASIITRRLPENEAAAIISMSWVQRSMVAGSGQGRRVGLQDLTPAPSPGYT